MNLSCYLKPWHEVMPLRGEGVDAEEQRPRMETQSTPTPANGPQGEGVGILQETEDEMPEL
jgi:hypothetical protein